MISANGGLPAHRYTPQVTPRWPRGSELASVASCRPGGFEEKLAFFCCRGKDFADELAYLVDLLVSGGKGVC